MMYRYSIIFWCKQGGLGIWSAENISVALNFLKSIKLLCQSMYKRVINYFDTIPTYYYVIIISTTTKQDYL